MTISAYDLPVRPFEAAHATIASGSRVTSAETKLRLLPWTTNWLAYGQMVLKRPSITWGATYLPPEVLKRSFLRSVMKRNSSSKCPMSPVWNQPSASITSAVCAGWLW